jgi:hypothetical protein
MGFSNFILNKSFGKSKSNYKKIVIVLLIILVLIIVGIVLYFTVFKKDSKGGIPISTGSATTTTNANTTTTNANTTTTKYIPVPSDNTVNWVANLYKTLNWVNQPSSANSNSAVVSPEWIQWALKNPNSILQYYVNYRRTTQGNNCSPVGTDFWPTKDIEFNPVYSWNGLETAIYIWNKAIEMNNNSSDKPLGNITGFCDEKDINLRSMTLAALLANATVESAYFMVCKESTMLSTDPPTFCPGNTDNTTGPDRYNSRYCNNCDQANPKSYSCQGDGGSGTGGQCNNQEGQKDASKCGVKGQVLNNVCCAPNNVVYNMSKDSCDMFKTAGYVWCKTSSDKPTTTKPSFNPTKDNCTGGWQSCQISSPFKLPDINTDPCMSDPLADGSFQNQLDNNNVRCTDWNGNKWDQQQNCYFGRGLIQLTWSCNYYKVQNIYTRMSKLFANTSDQILNKFVESMDAKNINSSKSCNLCANPDILCGDYTLNGNTIIYSEDQIKQAIPWLSCIIFWSFAVNPTWLKCYSFSASYAGIAPAGAGAYEDRLKAYKQLLTIMGVDPKLYIVSSTDIQLATCIS